MIRRPPRSTQSRSSAASDVYKRQQMGGAAIQGLVEFLAGADFDLDGEPAMPRALQRVAHAAGRRDVVVLDQDGIVEAHAVVGDAAAGGGGLLQGAQAG